MSAAIALRHKGVDVDLIEKHEANAVLGIGIILQGNALRALATLGVLDAVMAVGQEYAGFTFFDRNGENARHILGERTAGPDYPAMMGITRPAYSAILTEAAEAAGATIRYGVTVASLDQDADGVDVVFSDGRRARYDLVIGADGIHSATRRMIFGDEAVPRYSGQSAWRVNFPRPDSVDMLQTYDCGFGDKAGLVPLSRDLMYMYVTDKTPTPTLPEGDLREVLRAKLAGYGGMIGELRDTLPDSDKILWKPFEVVRLPAPWYKGRVLIIGDGAHAMTAHLGQGGAMAIEDAVVIAEELAASPDIDAALTGFMDRRFDRASRVQNWSDQLCQWEIDRSPEADHYGVMQQALALVRNPI